MTTSSDPSLEESTYDQPVAPTVPPTSVRPAPSSTASAVGTVPGNVGGTSGPDGEPEADQADQPEQQSPSFDERYAQPFNGLLYLGALSETFTWLRHEFAIRTLTTEEVLEVGMLVKPYQDTRTENRVYQCAVVAAGVVSVDGESLGASLVRGGSDLVVRYNYVIRNWHGPVIDYVFDRVFRLEITARQVLDQMGNQSG